jgi:membrane peptidoglycan carboxypeptidase
VSTPDFTGSGRHGRGSANDRADGQRRQGSHRGNGDLHAGNSQDYDDSARYGLGSPGGRPGNGYDDGYRRGPGDGARADDRYGNPGYPVRDRADRRGNDYPPREQAPRGGGRPAPRREAGGQRDDYRRDDYGRDDYRQGDYSQGDHGRGRSRGDYERDGYGRGDYGPEDYDDAGQQAAGQRGAGRGGRTADRAAAFEPARRGPFRRRRGGAGGDDGSGRPPKRKGSWWRHWTWKKAVGLVLACIGGVVVIGAVLIGVAYSSTQIPTDVSAMALQQASTVYFNNGKTAVGTFGTTDRVVLTSNQIPHQLKDAVVAAEDRSFYTEGGISPTGIIRAAWNDLRGTGSSQLQGGSTITQQFVRNYYADVGTQQTLSRKIKEIFVSVKLAKTKSKDWILTNYLNTIYFGDGAYGVGAAAKTFFDESASQLTIAQDAMIASMLNAPGQFDPVPGQPGYAPLVARWHYVLQGMVTLGDLTSRAASSLTFPKVDNDKPQSSGWTGYNGYIMQAVESELKNTYHYTLPEIDNDGLHIVTTFSQPMMNSLYATVNSEKARMAAAGTNTALPWFAHVGAVLEQPGTGAIVAMYSGPSYSESAKYCQRIDCQDDMALENREQVGSSFKPYVLSAARAQGMSVKTSVLDGTSPLCVPGDEFPMTYSVPAVNGACPTTPADGWHAFTNDEGDGATGPQSVVNATAQSLNTAYTDLTHRVGTQNVINMAKAFGVNTSNYPNGSNLQADRGEVGIALGQNSLTVEEQANTFAVLANDGEYATPHVIQQITQVGSVIAAKVTHREVLTPAEASDVDYALSFTTLSGTGTNAEMSDGRPMIGKTGTTSTAQSAFFLGAIPQYSFAVGIFTNNQNASTAANAQTLNNLGGLGGYGGDWPALIWHAFAQKQFLQLPVKQLPLPDFGGTSWNLMGNGEGLQPIKPKPTTSPQPHPTTSCTPLPLHPCGTTQPTTPPPTSPPPTSPPPTSPPPTCKPIRCGTPPAANDAPVPANSGFPSTTGAANGMTGSGAATSGDGGTSGRRAASTTPLAADRVRAAHQGGSG